MMAKFIIVGGSSGKVGKRFFIPINNYLHNYRILSAALSSTNSPRGLL